MEEEIIEQPCNENEEDSIQEEIEKTDSENQSGSIYGKFKNAKNLLEAYNALQSEFTRKSQKLAEIQKKIEENALFETKAEEIESVLNNCTDSDKYKKEIEEILAKNNEISGLPNKYRVAFETVKEAEYRLAKELNSQDFYDKYINNNEEIKSKIIDEYLLKLNNISVAPKIIAGNAANVYFSPQNKPRTMKEAGEIFSKMLK